MTLGEQIVREHLQWAVGMIETMLEDTGMELTQEDREKLDEAKAAVEGGGEHGTQ